MKRGTLPKSINGRRRSQGAIPWKRQVVIQLDSRHVGDNRDLRLARWSALVVPPNTHPPVRLTHAHQIPSDGNVRVAITVKIADFQGGKTGAASLPGMALRHVPSGLAVWKPSFGSRGFDALVKVLIMLALLVIAKLFVNV